MSLLHYSIFFHNYYGNNGEWLDFFLRELTPPFNLFYNCVSGSYHRLSKPDKLLNLPARAIPTPQIQLIVRESTNKGKDIGGKLVLMDAYLKLQTQSSYILLLHDKQSPYHTNSEQWRKDLFRIAEKQFLEKVFSVFKNESKVGIVASQNTIRNELNNEQKSKAYIDSPLITVLKKKYNLTPPHLQYVAGTMFWIRASLFENFFNQYAPLQIRSTLEEGNITDNKAPTCTHAWERMLCWIATVNGYQIKGI